MDYLHTPEGYIKIAQFASPKSVALVGLLQPLVALWYRYACWQTRLVN